MRLATFHNATVLQLSVSMYGDQGFQVHHCYLPHLHSLIESIEPAHASHQMDITSLPPGELFTMTIPTNEDESSALEGLARLACSPGAVRAAPGWPFVGPMPHRCPR